MANKNKKKGKIDEKKVYAIFCAVLAVLLILIGISVYSIVKDRKADEKPSNEESAQASTSVMQEKIKELNIEKNPVATIEMENGKKVYFSINFGEVSTEDRTAFYEISAQ